MKVGIPWPLKFAGKIAFGVLGIDYRILKRAHLVEHGRMEDADFSRSVFQRHVTALLQQHEVAPEGALVELGPGDSIATGVLGRSAGFREVFLIDAGSFADLRPASVNRLIAALGAAALVAVSNEAGEQEVLDQLRMQHIHYLTQGAGSLGTLVPGSVQHSFSNTVLQHVFRAQLPDLIRLLGRAHANGSYSSHSIKFSDHFSGGFVNHRLPAWFMESALVKRANLYTNRVGALEFCDLFEAAGFAIQSVGIDFFDGDPRGHVSYNSAGELRADAGSGRILRAVFLLQKVAS